MSRYADIAEVIADILEANVTGLQADTFPPEAVNHFPTTLVQPEPFDPRFAFGGNILPSRWRLTTLLYSGDAPSGWGQLAGFVDATAASNSILAALRSDPTLDGVVDTSEVVGLESISRKQIGASQYFGFDVLFDAIGGDSLARIGSTALVVASDASNAWPRTGNNVFVCDGVDDDVEIMAAYDALPTYTFGNRRRVGSIILTEGDFNVRPDQIIFNQKTVVLKGQGRWNTKLNQSANGTYLIEFRNDTGQNSGGSLRDFSAWGTGYTGSGLYFNPTAPNLDMGYDGYVLSGVAFQEFSVTGFKLGKAGATFNTLSAYDCMFQGNTYGLHVQTAGGTNRLLFMGCDFYSDIPVRIEASTVFNEDIQFFGGQLGGGGTSSWAVQLIGAYNVLFAGIRCEGMVRCFSIDADCHNITLQNIRCQDALDSASTIYIAGKECTIDSCHSTNNPSASPFIEIAAGAADNVIRNTLATITRPFISDSGDRTKYENCPGFVTRNSGASTGTGAQQTVAHGLAITPTRQQIALTAGSATALPFHSAAPDATNIYVTAANLQAWYWATVGT